MIYEVKCQYRWQLWMTYEGREFFIYELFEEDLVRSLQIACEPYKGEVLNEEKVWTCVMVQTNLH